MVSKDDMKKWAMELARSNKDTDPSISRIFWFPHGEEIRLVEVDETSMPSDVVLPFHFGPYPAGGVPLPFAVALVRPAEVRTIPLPDDWGSWEDAEELVVAGE